MERQFEKDEKQRQNEEISNNMNESWEFVSPNESESAAANSSKPCFIDASTLLDEHEVCLDGPVLPKSGCFGPKPIRDQYTKEDSFCDELMVFQCDDQQLATSSCSSLSLHQQEQERRKGQHIFENSINQFSGHKINLNDDNVAPNYFDKIRPTAVTGEDRTGLYTPFNSIVQLDYMRHCPSLQEEDPRTDLDSDRTEARRAELLTRKSYDESIPIVSGGSSIEDHFIRPNMGSPLVKRKTENCPIVSGGSTIVPSVENESPVKSRLSSSSSSNASWTINFSKNEPGSKPKVVPAPAAVENGKSNCGFFIDIGGYRETGSKIDKPMVTKLTTNDDSLRKSTGFFIDFSAEAKDQMPGKIQVTEIIEPQEKKNIFSMFVDISGQATETLASSFSKKKASLDTITVPPPGNVDKNSEITDEDRDSVVRLRTAEMSALHRNFELAAKQRHSWNESEQRYDEKKSYNRSVSMTSENAEPASLNLDSKLLSSKTSSMNIDSSIPSPLEDFSSKSLSSNYSNNSVTNSNSSNCGSLNDRQRRRRKDVKINETFDKSSAGSITDGILSSQDSSSSPISTTTEEVTCCPENMENGAAVTSIDNVQNNLKKSEPFGQRSNNQMEAIREQQDITKEAMAILQKTIEKQKQLLETVNENIDETQNKAFYVKLSDMDKPILDSNDQSTFISDIFSNSMSSALRSGRHRGSSAGGTSKHRQSWNMMTCSTGAGHIPASVNNLALSFENSKSLSRLFPHLSKGEPIYLFFLFQFCSVNIYLNHIICVSSFACCDRNKNSSFSTKLAIVRVF
jgi:BTB/POZ domain-containing protein 8